MALSVQQNKLKACLDGVARLQQAQREHDTARRQQAEAALAAEQQAGQHMQQLLGGLAQDMQGVSAGQSSFSQVSLDPSRAPEGADTLAQEPATQQDDDAGPQQSPVGPMQSPAGLKQSPAQPQTAPARTGTLPRPERAESGSTRSSRGDSREPDAVGQGQDGPKSQPDSIMQSPHGSSGKEQRGDTMSPRQRMQAQQSQTQVYKQGTPSHVEV